MPSSEKNPRPRIEKESWISPTDSRIRVSDFIRPPSFVLGILLSLLPVAALDIQMPPETGAFKQDTGAEIANGQCLICHSVEYVTMQPRMPRAFWKASVEKMQKKYGAPIPDDQVAPLVEYLVHTYGNEKTK